MTRTQWTTIRREETAEPLTKKGRISSSGYIKGSILSILPYHAKNFTTVNRKSRQRLIVRVSENKNVSLMIHNCTVKHMFLKFAGKNDNNMTSSKLNLIIMS